MIIEVKDIEEIKSNYGSVDYLRNKFLSDFKSLSFEERKTYAIKYMDDFEKIDRMITNVELARGKRIDNNEADRFHFVLFGYWRFFRSAVILLNKSLYDMDFINFYHYKPVIPRDIVEAKMFMYNVSSPKEVVEYEAKEKAEDGRQMYLYGEVNFANVIPIVQSIIQINKQDSEMKLDTCSRKPICIHVCSKGGNSEDMWFLIDHILHSKTPINTYCCGYAKDEAFLIFLAGEERYMSQHASVGCDLNFYDSHCAVDNFNEVKEIEKIIFSRTKLEIQKMDGDIDIRGYYYPDKIAVGNGVVNAII